MWTTLATGLGFLLKALGVFDFIKQAIAIHDARDNQKVVDRNAQLEADNKEATDAAQIRASVDAMSHAQLVDGLRNPNDDVPVTRRPT